MGNSRRRTVIREDDLEIDLIRLFGSVQDGDLFLEGAEALLSRDPLIGEPAEKNSLIWILPMAPIDDRSVSLYYTFDSQTVILLGLSSF